MLDIQDFPGQGTALVGLLDAFMDSKGIMEAKDFSSFVRRWFLLRSLINIRGPIQKIFLLTFR